MGAARDPGAVRALGEPARRVHRGLPAPGLDDGRARDRPLARDPGLGPAQPGRRARRRRGSGGGDRHGRHAARVGDLVVPPQLPEPGDLAGEHRVGVGLQLAAGGRLPDPGDRLRGLDVGPLAAAPSRHHPPGDRRLPRLRRVLGPEHRLHRPGAGAAGRLDRAESKPLLTAAARGAGRRGGCGRRIFAAVLGPARDDPTLGFPVADYAIAHPPEHGRIVTYAGVGSYINWRSPNTPVVFNGWLEQYTPQELRDNYGVLRAGTAGTSRRSQRIHAGAVIAHCPSDPEARGRGLSAGSARPAEPIWSAWHLRRKPERALRVPSSIRRPDGVHSRHR